MRRPLLFALALVLLGGLLLDARSVEWRGDSYNLYADKQDIREILRDFCAAQGVSAVISPGVAGTVSGRFEDLPPAEFLDLLAQSHALTWYYDGHILHVYRADETQSRMLSLSRIDPDRLKTTLTRLALWDDRFAWRTVEEEGLLHVSGPPRLVRLVEETAAYLEDRAARELQATEEVRVFPLRHAWADDLTLTFLKREVTVPGVATTLRAIMTDQAGAGGRLERRLPATLTGLRGSGLAAEGRDREDVGEPRRSDRTGETEAGQTASDQQGGTLPPAQGSQGTQGTQGTQGIQARIMADTRLNAVVVRDAREKMPLYEDLIEDLDVAVGVIEIQAAIMDVDVNFTRELGVNWRFGAVVPDGFHSAGGLDVSEGFAPDGMDAIIQGSGLNLSTLYADSVSNLLTRIHALENRGNARVLSRPTVLTLDNVEAHIENTKTLHVRLTGERDVDLFKVDTGTVLEVTPRIIHEQGRRRIKLLVNIRDGTYSQTTSVDDIPEISESAVNTQAVVELGQSLLLGGFYMQRLEDKQDGIPLLMHIPVLGHAFKTTKKQERTLERLFLITPRIVEMDARTGQPLSTSDPRPENGDAAPLFSAAQPGQPDPFVQSRKGSGCAAGRAPREMTDMGQTD
jgi:type III secretion protein C